MPDFKGKHSHRRCIMNDQRISMNCIYAVKPRYNVPVICRSVKSFFYLLYLLSKLNF